MAQSTPSTAAGKAGGEEEIPVSKHQLKPSATQVLKHDIEEQGKQIEQIVTLLQTQVKQSEAQTKQMDDLTKRAELQTKQIETLNADVTRLTTVLLARGVDNSAAPSTSTPAQPHASGTPVVQTPEPPTAKAEPVPAESPATNPEGYPTHIIKRGENLISVARQHGTTVSELLKLNKIEDERKLQIGQTLLLPKSAPTKPDALPSPPKPDN